MADVSCARCIYFDAFPTERFGLCRASLPNTSGDKWPTVHAERDWCGSWTARMDTAAVAPTEGH